VGGVDPIDYIRAFSPSTMTVRPPWPKRPAFRVESDLPVGINGSEPRRGLSDLSTGPITEPERRAYTGWPFRFLHGGINAERRRVLIELEEEAKDIFDGPRNRHRGLQAGHHVPSHQRLIVNTQDWVGAKPASSWTPRGPAVRPVNGRIEATPSAAVPGRPPGPRRRGPVRSGCGPRSWVDGTGRHRHGVACRGSAAGMTNGSAPAGPSQFHGARSGIPYDALITK
jgi:hypothetical protein